MPEDSTRLSEGDIEKSKALPDGEILQKLKKADDLDQNGLPGQQIDEAMIFSRELTKDLGDSWVERVPANTNEDNRYIVMDIIEDQLKPQNAISLTNLLSQPTVSETPDRSVKSRALNLLEKYVKQDKILEHDKKKMAEQLKGISSSLLKSATGRHSERSTNQGRGDLFQSIKLMLTLDRGQITHLQSLLKEENEVLNDNLKSSLKTLIEKLDKKAEDKDILDTKFEFEDNRRIVKEETLAKILSSENEFGKIWKENLDDNKESYREQKDIKHAEFRSHGIEVIMRPTNIQIGYMVDGSDMLIPEGVIFGEIDFMPDNKEGYSKKDMLKYMRLGYLGMSDLVRRINEPVTYENGVITSVKFLVGQTNRRMARMAERMGFKIIDKNKVILSNDKQTKEQQLLDEDIIVVAKTKDVVDVFITLSSRKTRHYSDTFGEGLAKRKNT